MSRRLLDDRYRLDQRLGRGGTATVWRGYDTHLDRAVAVKVLDRLDPGRQELPRRLRQEARIIAQLDHPNIVAVHDFGIDQDVAYLVMALVAGRNLAEILVAEGPLAAGRAVAIAADVCAALQAAHTAGVVHRDIKPGNIIVSTTGVLKVCDFGIARLQVRDRRPSLEAGSTIEGTCEFMAPEYVTGGPVSARGDLYALGCVLYAMLAGRPPFVAENPIDVLDQHLRAEPRPLRTWRTDLHPELDRLVSDLIAKDPADRPASAAVVRERLARIGPSGTTARPAPRPAGTDTLTAAPRPAGTDTLTAAPRPAGVPGDVSPGPPGERPTSMLSRATTGGGRHRDRHRDRVPALASASASLRQRSAAAASVVAIVVALSAVGATVAYRHVAAPPRAEAPPPAPPVTATEQPARQPTASIPAPTDGAPKPTAAPTAEPTVAAPPPHRATAPPRAERPTSFAAAIQQQIEAGNLDARAGADLLHRIARIARLPPVGRKDKVAHGLADVGRRLNELRRDGRLTEAGFDVLIGFTS